MIFPRPFAVDILDSGTLGRSVIRAETYLAPSDSFGFQANDSSDSPLITIDPDADDTQSDQFNIVARSFDFTGTQNFVVRMGHNMNPAGAPVNAARPMMGDEYEQFYKSGSFRSAERHIGVFQAPGRAVQRPITIFLDSVEAAPSIAGNNLGINIEQLYVNDGLSASRRLTVDGTTGVLVTNVPLAVSHTSTSKDGLTIGLPASTTGKFISATYNSGEFWAVSPYGEHYLQGSGKAGAGSRNAMLEILGRSGTTDNLRVSASDGTTRMRIVEGSGSFTSISFAGAFQNSGPFKIFDTNGSTERFRVDEAGGIRSSAITAASAVGSITGVLPIKSIAGTQYYLPLYGSFTP